MKKAVLFLLLALAQSSFALEYVTVFNTSGGRCVVDAYFPAIDHAWESVLMSLEPGQTVYVPKGTFVYASWVYPPSDPVNPYCYGWFSLDDPVYFIMTDGWWYSISSYNEKYFDDGLALGIPTSGAMLVLWLLQLIRKPVVEG